MFSNRSLWPASLAMMINAQDMISRARGSLRLRTLTAVLVLGFAGGFAADRAQALEILGFKLFESDTPDTVEVVDPLSYSVTLEVAGEDPDGTLKEELEAASALVQGADRPVAGSIGLIQRANGDFEQLIAALYENARYAGEVRILLDGRRLADLPPDTDLSGGGAVPVRILVEPGKPFRFGDVSVRDVDGRAYATDEQGLVSGQLAKSTVILEAENALVQELEKSGHPFARVSGRDVVADHARGVIDVSLELEAGPVAPFGQTAVEGAESVDRDFIARMAGVPQGDQYDPAALAAVRELAEHGRHHLERCRLNGDTVPAGAAPAFLTLALVPAVIEATAEPGYDPYASDLAASRLRSLWRLWRASRRMRSAAGGGTVPVSAWLRA